MQIKKNVSSTPKHSSKRQEEPSFGNKESGKGKKASYKKLAKECVP